MKIIPAIDLIGGKCVRLTNGDYNQKTEYKTDPVEMAKVYESYGIEHLHLVDLEGAKTKGIVNYKTLENITSKTGLKVDFGGGIKSEQDLYNAFEAGANQVTAGSMAVEQPALLAELIEQYGSDKIILGADCKNRKIATNGWLEDSQLDVLEFIQNYESKGIKQVICTDISKDGRLEGTSNQLYAEIIENTNVKLIASGGVSCTDDLRKLKKLGCDGAIVGKAIYEGKITLKEIKYLC